MKMFSLARKFSMLTCPSDDGFWEGEFTVNYNLDDEAAFDSTNKLAYPPAHPRLCVCVVSRRVES